MKKRMLLLVIAIIFIVAMGTGCSTPAETVSEDPDTKDSADVVIEDQPEDKQYVIGYAPTTMNNAFWLAVLEPIKAEIEARGDKLVTIDPQNDQSRMNDQIGDLVVQGIDALLIAPVDSTGVEPALVSCRNAGIPVINFDTPVTNKDLVETIIASDNYNAGVVVAKDMMSKLDEGSKIAFMHSPAGGACIDRAAGFYNTIGDYFEVVVELDGKGDTGVTLPLAEDVLQGTPNLAAFFAVNDPSAIGCINALASHPEMEGILIYGVDGNPDAKKLVQEGKMTATAAQSPATIGLESIRAAYTLIDGSSVEKEISVDTFLITADNVAEYGTDGWQ